MHKDKIVLELMKQFAGLSKKLAEGIADKLTPTITEESQIEGAVSKLKEGPISIMDIVTEGDRRATDAVARYKSENPTNPVPTPDPNNPTPTPTPTPTPNNPTETPEQKTLRELMEKVNGFEREKKVESLRASLIAKLKEKGIPEAMAANLTIAEDTDIETLFTGIETNYTTIKQAVISDGLKNNSFVPGGTIVNKDANTVLSDIDNWAKQNEPAPAAK